MGVCCGLRLVFFRESDLCFVVADVCTGGVLLVSSQLPIPR